MTEVHRVRTRQPGVRRGTNARVIEVDRASERSTGQNRIDEHIQVPAWGPAVDYGTPAASLEVPMVDSNGRTPAERLLGRTPIQSASTWHTVFTRFGESHSEHPQMLSES